MNNDIIQLGNKRLVFKTHEKGEWVYATMDTATVISLEELENEEFWMVKKDFFLDSKEYEEKFELTVKTTRMPQNQEVNELGDRLFRVLESHNLNPNFVKAVKLSRDNGNFWITETEE